MADGQIKVAGNADNDQVNCYQCYKGLEISPVPDGVFASRFACMGKQAWLWNVGGVLMWELSWIFVPLLTFSPWYKGCGYLYSLREACAREF